MNDLLVSVIIPCYNAEKYVEKAVRSIMEQTFKNLEILCCDDRSTDSTLSILEKLAAEDCRVKIIKNEANLKIVKTLNKLVCLANGKYIARMDADDISLPERIEKQVEFLETNPTVGLCGCNVIHINEKGEKLRTTKLPLSFEEVKFVLKYYSCFYHPSVIARSEVLKENSYSQNFIYAEDYELWCRLVFEKVIECENLPKALLQYRFFEGQTSVVHLEEQRESVGKIFDSYNFIQPEFKTSHKNIFYLHEMPDNFEKQYLISQAKKLSSFKQKKTILYSLQTLISHCLKFHKKITLIKVCCNPIGGGLS